MGTIINNVSQYYHYINDDLADPRTNAFWLVSTPIPIAVIMFLYHRFVHSWGPQFMANRPAYNLKNTIILYNIVQIFLSGLMTFECIRWLYLPGYYNVWCQKINYEDNEVERKIIGYVWLYYVIKIVDLLDTVFFVLRKKFNQVSFLHVYHHLGMCLLGFIGTKFVPGNFAAIAAGYQVIGFNLQSQGLIKGREFVGGHGVMLGFINSIVHTVMYSYYLISIVRREWVRIWWKKYITQLQILQFLLLILHFGHVIFEPSCAYPKWVSFVFLPHNIFILILFTDFYLKEYIYKKKKNN